MLQGSENDRRENGMNLRKFQILAIGFISGMIGLATISCTGTADVSNVTGSSPSTISCNKLLSGTGMTTLNWTPPNQNSDDSELTDLAGFIVYFGPAAGAMTCSVIVDNPAATDYPMTNLMTNTEYAFAITAYNSTGVESDISNIILKMVN
jgi:hypothetical protein